MCFHLQAPSEFTLQGRAFTPLYPFPFDHHSISFLPSHSLHLALFLSVTPFFSSSGDVLFPCTPSPLLLFINCIESCFMSPPSLSLSRPLSVSLIHSSALSHLGDSSVHAGSNLSRCLSGCSVYARCAALLSSPLCTILHCTALHISPHISISPSLSLLSLSLPASLSLCCSVLHSALLFGFFRARAEYTSATGGGGSRCSWVSRFGLPWTPWICLGWSKGEVGEGREGPSAA